MNPTLRQIRYFIAAAEAGQLSKAAMEVNVSQSAITTAVKSLENLIGTSLFDRHSGGVNLTYEGSLFLSHARGIINSVEEAVRIPRRVQQEVKGSFRLAVTYTVAGYFLPPLFLRFTHAFPNVEVNLIEADRQAIEEGLITGSFDIAVMLTSNIINHDALAHSVMLRSRRRLWLNEGHRFVDSQSVTLEEIAQEPFIMLTVDEASNTAQRYWDRTTYQPRTLFQTSSVEAVRSMVANGMGVSVLSDMVYRPWSLEGKRVDVMEVNDIIPTMDVGLAWAKHAELNSAAKAFFEFMDVVNVP